MKVDGDAYTTVFANAKAKYGTDEIWTRLDVDAVLSRCDSARDRFQKFGVASRQWTAPVRWSKQVDEFEAELKAYKKPCSQLRDAWDSIRKLEEAMASGKKAEQRA